MYNEEEEVQIMLQKYFLLINSFSFRLIICYVLLVDIERDEVVEMWMLVKSQHCVQLRVYKYQSLRCVHSYVSSTIIKGVMRGACVYE